MTLGALGWAFFVLTALANLFLVASLTDQDRRVRRLEGEVVATRLSSLSGSTPNGTQQVIAFPDKQSGLIFTFSAGCKYCKESLPLWRELAERAKLAGWSVTWVSRDSGADTFPFATSEKLDGSVLADVPYRSYIQLGLSQVPRTIAVSPDGQVLESVTGVLDTQGKDRIVSVMLDRR